MSTLRAEQVTPALADHGEGPVWLARTGAVGWLDMNAGSIILTDLRSGESRSHQLPVDVIGCVRQRRGSGYIAAFDSRIGLLDDDFAIEAVVDWRPVADDVAFNDGGCDPAGRFFAGTAAKDERPGAGQLVVVALDGSVRVLFDQLTIANGIDWSPDGTSAYFVDSATARVDQLDVDVTTGQLGRRRPLIDIPEREGVPDGLCVDAAGVVWIALWGGGKVVAVTGSGERIHEVVLPVPHVTACTFGGEGLDRLFITTSRGELGGGADPRAGALFQCAPGSVGQPPRSYAGTF